MFKLNNDTSDMTVHEVKILPIYFEPVLKGIKTFEIRKNDRGYHVGDSILLKEWEGDHYSGREALFDITYLLENYEAIPKDYVIMSIVPHR